MKTALKNLRIYTKHVLNKCYPSALCNMHGPIQSHKTVPLNLTSNVWQGWASYLDDETTEFEKLAVSWATNTSLPSWLTGSYVSPFKSRLWIIIKNCIFCKYKYLSDIERSGEENL
jgi:hypothetical protein